MLSVQLLESMEELAANARRDLILHLVATHHGFARPFAPVVPDDEPPPVDLSSLGAKVQLDSDERRNGAPHSLSTGHSDRFWRMIRYHGWWGLAYIETILRLTDQQVSASYEQNERATNKRGMEVTSA